MPLSQPTTMGTNMGHVAWAPTSKGWVFLCLSFSKMLILSDQEKREARQKETHFVLPTALG